MSTNPTAPPLHHGQAVDDAVLAYVQWREECMAVWHGYGRWTSATAEDKVSAHAAYLAALDREDAAANFYAELIERVGDLLDSEAMAPHHSPTDGA